MVAHLSLKGKHAGRRNAMREEEKRPALRARNHAKDSILALL